jgi:hypothetical protein
MESQFIECWLPYYSVATGHGGYFCCRPMRFGHGASQLRSERVHRTSINSILVRILVVVEYDNAHFGKMTHSKHFTIFVEEA